MLFLSSTPKFTIIDIHNNNNNNTDLTVASRSNNNDCDCNWREERNRPYCDTSSDSSFYAVATSSFKDDDQMKIVIHPPKKCIYIDLNCQYTQRY